ncbi:MAG: hypothetical protein JWN34_1479 [Bryobacterales bacterium]|nr:hypothetical protein [Bryobacterales bacterium]
MTTTNDTSLALLILQSVPAQDGLWRFVPELIEKHMSSAMATWVSGVFGLLYGFNLILELLEKAKKVFNNAQPSPHIELPLREGQGQNAAITLVLVLASLGTFVAQLLGGVVCVASLSLAWNQKLEPSPYWLLAAGIALLAGGRVVSRWLIKQRLPRLHRFFSFVATASAVVLLLRFALTQAAQVGASEGGQSGNSFRRRLPSHSVIEVEMA